MVVELGKEGRTLSLRYSLATVCSILTLLYSIPTFVDSHCLIFLTSHGHNGLDSMTERDLDGEKSGTTIHSTIYGYDEIDDHLPRQ